MRKTGNLRKLVSAFLAGMTLLSAVLSPMPAYAAEPEKNTIPPCLEDGVKVAVMGIVWLPKLTRQAPV